MEVGRGGDYALGFPDPWFAGRGVHVLFFLCRPWVHVSSTFTPSGCHTAQMLQPEPEGKLRPSADSLSAFCGGWGRP